jgi:tyrosyl-tRNA synthetase
MTYQPKSEFLRVMIERGFLADCTDMQGLDEALMRGPSGLYRFRRDRAVAACGQPDPDHDAALAAKTGHKPITLMGGGTTKVGDPSGRADRAPAADGGRHRPPTSPGIKSGLRPLSRLWRRGPPMR